MEAQGVDVEEWDRASKGRKLPERKSKRHDFAGDHLKHRASNKS
jgi:hypothetical protein